MKRYSKGLFTGGGIDDKEDHSFYNPIYPAAGSGADPAGAGAFTVETQGRGRTLDRPGEVPAGKSLGRIPTPGEAPRGQADAVRRAESKIGERILFMKYEKLSIDFPIPDFLEEEIDKFLAYLNDENESGHLEDCFRTEIDLAIRDSRLPEKQREYLKDYYVRKGIYYGKGYPWEK